MSDLRAVWELVSAASSWGWWSWVASRWSGGGPGHRSYPEARFNAYVAGCRVRDWMR
jgi:hypothetical protein